MINERLELTILRNLFYTEAYVRKVLPFLKTDYFSNRIERLMFEQKLKGLI